MTAALMLLAFIAGNALGWRVRGIYRGRYYATRFAELERDANKHAYERSGYRRRSW